MQLSVIDVSEHQGNIDWEKVKNAGVVGAMIRTGYGVKDPNQIDKWFYNNLSGCQNVGMPYGFYHYSYAVDVAGAEQEADFCLELIAGSNPQYPVAFDMEENRQAALGKTVCTDMAIAFCNKIRAAGYQPMLYTNLNWATNYIDMSQIDNAGIRVWIAQYNTTLDYKGNYFLWQYTSSGRVAGIPANVDLNYLGSDAGEITPSQPPVTDNNTYTVKAGDTLWDIAQSQLGNGSRYKEIMTLNGLTSDIIQPGQVLKLPVGGASNAGSDTTKTYTVKTGDTLWDIAQTLLDNGARYKEIVSLNNLHSSIIYPGQVLKIPE